MSEPKIFDNEYSVKQYILNNSDKSLRGIYIKDLSIWSVGNAEDYIHLTLLTDLFSKCYIDTDLKPLQYMYSNMEDNNFIIYFFEPYNESTIDSLSEEFSLQRCVQTYSNKDKTILVGCSDNNCELKEVLQ